MRITKEQKQEFKNLLTDAILFLNTDFITLEQYKGYIDNIYYNYFKVLDNYLSSWLNDCGYHFIFLKEYQDQEGYDRLKKESINAINSFIKKLGIEGLGL